MKVNKTTGISLDQREDSEGLVQARDLCETLNTRINYFALATHSNGKRALFSAEHLVLIFELSRYLTQTELLLPLIHSTADIRIRISDIPDTKTEFGSVDRANFWQCFPINGVPRQVISILWASYAESRRPAHPHGFHSPELAKTSSIIHSCPKPSYQQKCS